MLTRRNLFRTLSALAVAPLVKWWPKRKPPEIFTVTARKPEHALFAEKLRVSLNRLADEDSAFRERMLGRHREEVLRDVLGVPIPQEEA